MEWFEGDAEAESLEASSELVVLNGCFAVVEEAFAEILVGFKVKADGRSKASGSGAVAGPKELFASGFLNLADILGRHEKLETHQGCDRLERALALVVHLQSTHALGRGVLIRTNPNHVNVRGGLEPLRVG